MHSRWMEEPGVGKKDGGGGLGGIGIPKCGANPLRVLE